MNINLDRLVVEALQLTALQRKVVSLMSRLKLPSPSDFGQKGIVASNPSTGKRQSHSFTGNEPKNTHPSQRVKEFASEPLKVNHNKKLFCKTCWEELSII